MTAATTQAPQPRRAYVKKDPPCPACGHRRCHVIDPRPIDFGVERTRRCEKCGTRFLTVELVVRYVGPGPQRESGDGNGLDEGRP